MKYLIGLLLFLVACAPVVENGVGEVIQKDDRKYISEDPEECTRLMFMCAEGEPFYDETGCGCTTEDLEPEEPRQDCTTDEKQAVLCAEIYQPVCGWFAENIRCIKWPCASTYSNRCFACQDENVGSVTEGECPAEEPIQVRCVDKDRDIKNCPDLYEPVCGFGEDVLRTYDNRCLACKDFRIASYMPGSCIS